MVVAFFLYLFVLFALRPEYCNEACKTFTGFGEFIASMVFKTRKTWRWVAVIIMENEHVWMDIKKRENIRQRNFVNNYFTELTEIQILHASEKTIANDFFYFKYCTSEPVINF